MSPTASTLRDVLSARAEATKTFQADVVLTQGPGKDVQAIVENRRRYADWVDKSHPEYAKENEQFRKRIEAQLKMPTNVHRYAYASDAAGRIRVQVLPDAAQTTAPQEGVTRLRIFNGSEWTAYNERTDKQSGDKVAEMNLKSQDRSNLSWLEVARGLGIFLRERFQRDLIGFELGPRAVAAELIDWRDLLRNIPLEQSRVETSNPPGHDAPRPSLILETKPFRDSGKGLFRLQIWLEPDHGYAPCAMKASDLEPAGKEAWDHLADYIVEWHDPVEINGVTIYRRCSIRFHERLGLVDEAAPDEEWKHQAFESQVFEYAFANIRMDEPIDPGQFDIKPVAGTNVIDEPKGFVYVVGKAGEQLEKTAISERDRIPAEAAKPKSGLQWRTVFILFNVLFLLALISYWVATRKRDGSRE